MDQTQTGALQWAGDIYKKGGKKQVPECLAAQLVKIADDHKN